MGVFVDRPPKTVAARLETLLIIDVFSVLPTSNVVASTACPVTPGTWQL